MLKKAKDKKIKKFYWSEGMSSVSTVSRGIVKTLKSTYNDKKQIPPMSIYKLKKKYLNLYFLLDQNNNNTSNPRISNQTERERGV